MNKLKLLLVGALLLVGVESSRGFVMIGQMLAQEVSQGATDFNITDDLGGPKDLKQFYRWNNPFLTYTFDQSFVRYFGLEGMDAVHDAFRVVNDFFIPADGSYKGVSSMDFARDGYLSNFNTTWVNTTAQNGQIIDIKSLTLGMLVNHLGVGNPHRYAFSVAGISTNVTGTQWSFNVRLKNFDPVTWQPTDVINGVQYSYRLIHDAAPQAGGAIIAPTFVDMEEFTTDTSGNAWSAVAGIVDAFYGNTAIYWTDTPTAFNFGVYYDAYNAMGGQYQPRHALTYDDVGALKYMYRTNNFVYEDLDLSINLIEPPQFLTGQAFLKNSAQNFLQPTYPNTLGVFPRRNVTGAIPGFATTSPMRGVPIIGSPTNPSQMVGAAMRGGIDRMQYYYMPLDSLLGTLFTATNFIWTDTFITTNGWKVSGLNNTTPGASAWIGHSDSVFYSQKVGRTVTAPDIIFVCDDLGQAADGVPVAWNRTDNTQGWTNNGAWSNVGLVALNTTNVGPGTINVPASGIIYTFSNLGNSATSGSFEVLWTGEASVVGNQTPSFSLWGHIKGPGPEDVVTFPRDATVWRLENELAPKVSVPLITMISDNGGLNAIRTNSFTRTEETITIGGSGLASVTHVEIMHGDRVVQTIFPVDRYIVNDLRIDIPKGVLTEETEGSARTVRVWNTVGVSLKSVQFFNIYTGRAVITGTSRDGQLYDRATPITIYGYGFKSLQTRSADGNATLTHVRLEDGQGNVVSPEEGNSTAVIWEVVSDTLAHLPLDTFDFKVDGDWRRLRAARSGSANTLSATNNVALIEVITSIPNITTIQTVEASGTSTAVTASNALRRDRALDINGTALNTAYAIEIVNKNGSSLANPVIVYLDSPGITVDANGTRIQISAGVIPYSDADGHAAVQQRKFKVFNRVSDHTPTTVFNVNVQPEVTGLGAFTLNNAFNRHQISGDDVTIFGTGLLAVTEIEMVDENGTAFALTPKIVLPHPGVTVTDTFITIDTQTAQFVAASSADSKRGDSPTLIGDRFRRFMVTSNRDTKYTSPDTSFMVGVPPTYTSLAGAGTDYRRDSDTITYTGTGLILLDTVQIVDVNGNPIVGVTAATDTTGVGTVSKSTFTLDANAAAFTNQEYRMDSSLLIDGNGTRRVLVTTPFGIALSPASVGFTISATPDFLPISTGNSANTFAGSADFNGSDYNASYPGGLGLLVINGSNFRGLKRIYLGNSTAGPSGSTELYTSNNSYIDVDPNALPAGITINPEGTQISMTKLVIDNIDPLWLNDAVPGAGSTKRILLMSAADQNSTSSVITPYR
jgi:hypothetical protein